MNPERGHLINGKESEQGKVNLDVVVVGGTKTSGPKRWAGGEVHEKAGQG